MNNVECGGRPKVLCGKYKTGRVCGGDSGGTAVADRDADGVWVQYGIMSYIKGPQGVSNCIYHINARQSFTPVFSKQPIPNRPRCEAKPEEDADRDAFVDVSAYVDEILVQIQNNS